MPNCFKSIKLSVSTDTNRPSPSANLLYRRKNVADLVQPEHDSQTFKLIVAYDGTDFSGWQVQPGELTIQGELQNALGRVTGESPLPQGSGRTDAGVHALAQVASFSLAGPDSAGEPARCPEPNFASIHSGS